MISAKLGGLKLLKQLIFSGRCHTQLKQGVNEKMHTRRKRLKQGVNE